MRILIVEDDFISRRLLSRYLEPFGECDVAINGNEALCAVKRAIETREQYDLICLDIMMPGMNGQETLKKIRSLEIEHDIVLGRGAKVIMTSSLEDHDSIRKAFKAKADGYAVKPIEKKQFLAILHDIGLQLELPL